MKPSGKACAAVALGLACAWALAQPEATATPPTSTATPASTGGLLPTPPGAVIPPGGQAGPSAAGGARFIESCQQALDRGEAAPGCQGALYANEIAGLRNEALRSNNPALLTLLGDSYLNNRSAVSDVGQAYRWYLLAAVRGDPRAMQRLSELYQGGRGAPQDRVRAMGYARLAQRLAVPGSKAATDAAQASASLGTTMAAEELALADRFAQDLEATLRRDGAPLDAQSGASTTEMGRPGGITLHDRAAGPAPRPAIPGMSNLSPAPAR